MSKLNKRPPIVFIVGVALACMTLLSVHMTSGLYARYTSQGSGADDARVAKFAITDMLTVKKADNTAGNTFAVGDVLIPGASTTYTFAVTNSSEVAVSVEMVMQSPLQDSDTLMGELPIKLRLVGDPLVLGPGKSGTVTYEVYWDTSDPKYLDVSYGYKVDAIELAVVVKQID